MAGDKAEPRIETMRVGARIIAGELHEAAAGGAGGLNRVANEPPADPEPAACGSHPNALDLTAFRAAPGKAGDDRQLQAADDLFSRGEAALGDEDAVAALRGNAVKGGEVRAEIVRSLARRAQRVVGEQRDDRRHVFLLGGADGDVVRRHELPASFETAADR